METFTDSRCRAFTLIELLVVISIIAILAALMLPALGTAQESSRIAHCSNNLNQIGKGLQMYADANKDRLPLMKTGGGYASWANRIVEYAGSSNLFVCMSDPVSHNAGDRTYAANGKTGTSSSSYPFSDKSENTPMRFSDFDNNVGDLILVGERPVDTSGTRGTMQDDKSASMENTPGTVHRRGRAANYLMASMAVRFIEERADVFKLDLDTKGNLWTVVTK